jgi:hypothetical protein
MADSTSHFLTSALLLPISDIPTEADDFLVEVDFFAVVFLIAITIHF